VALAHAPYAKGRKLKWKQTQVKLQKEFGVVIENSNHIKAKKVGTDAFALNRFYPRGNAIVLLTVSICMRAIFRFSTFPQ